MVGVPVALESSGGGGEESCEKTSEGRELHDESGWKSARGGVLWLYEEC